MVKLRLLGCPFCGAIPEAQRWHGGGKRKTMVECQQDIRPCPNPSITGPTPEKAAAIWNARGAAIDTETFTDVVVQP